MNLFNSLSLSHCLHALLLGVTQRTAMIPPRPHMHDVPAHVPTGLQAQEEEHGAQDDQAEGLSLACVFGLRAPFTHVWMDRPVSLYGLLM